MSICRCRPAAPGTIKIATLDSFIEVAKRFCDSDSVLFGDPTMTAPRLTAVFNLQPPGGDQITGLDGIGVARHGDHRAVYDFPLSDEWKLG
jgi:hypothetical protein